MHPYTVRDLKTKFSVCYVDDIAARHLGPSAQAI